MVGSNRLKLLKTAGMGQGSIEPGCNLQLRVLVRAPRDALGVGDLATPQ